MRLALHRRLLLVLVALGLAGPAFGQSFGFAWWKSEQFQKDLSLSAAQIARIDDVFQGTMPKLRQSKKELDQQEEDLSRLIETNADEAVVSRQSDRVEATRGALNKMRTLMLLRMRQVLTPDQRVKLNQLHEIWVRDPHRQTQDSAPKKPQD